MKTKEPEALSPISASRKRIYGLISILIPFIGLVFIELMLRFSGYGNNHSLFITHPDEGFENYRVVNPDIGKKYFSKMEYSVPSKDRFLKQKPEDVIRIFVMGSSTVIGFPYDNNLMFSRILQERLRDAYPGKKIEMVNTAITAINSFTLTDFMPQILKEKPDAVLIYAGHNEFYGAFGAGSNEAAYYNPTLIRLHLKLINFRIYQLAFNTMGRITSIFSNNEATRKSRTLMARIVKDADILYGSDTYLEGIENFRKNLNTMLESAKKENVTVFISDLVSNLRDTKPFKSITSEKSKGADDYYQAARKYEKQGEIQKAKENYLLAQDYDCIRFRASSDIQSAILELADQYQAHFVPTLDLFQAQSPNGIVGDNLLTEHVHPNINGAFLLSEAFYKEIIQSKIIADQVNTETEKSLSNFKKGYGFSELDSLIGHHRITNLKYHWPFTDESKGTIDYRLIYKPVGTTDSLAFNVMAKKQTSLVEAHEFLGDQYWEKGDYLKAWKEYNSLTQIIPFRGLYYRKTADCLLRMNDLPAALHFYERSTDHDPESFYAHFRAGEICMIKNDFESALAHFQKSQSQATKEEKEKSLVKIYQALTYLNRAEEGKEIAAYFKQTTPNKPILVPPRTNNYKEYIPQQVKGQVEEAKKLMAVKEPEKALALLSQTIDIKETHVAYRLLGELYYKNKEFEKSRPFLMKAYPEFKFDTSFLTACFLTNMTLGKMDDAKNILNQIKKTDPSYPGIVQFQLMLKNTGTLTARQ